MATKKSPDEAVQAEPEAKPAPAATPSQAAVKSAAPRGFRRKLVGVVTSDKMDKTVTVEVTRRYLDPIYERYVRDRAAYKAHDDTNKYHVGDRVEIQEHRPISRTKRWSVTRLVSSGGGPIAVEV